MSLHLYKSGLQTQDLKLSSDALKAMPGDHVRTPILRAIPTAASGWRPIFQDSLLKDLRDFLWKAGHAYNKKRVIVCTESWNIEYDKLFDAWKASGNVSHFDLMLTQVAEVLKDFPPGYVAFEWGHEPGIFKRKTSDPVEAARFIQAWWNHAVPLIKTIIPKVPLILPSAGFGYPTDGYWQHIQPVKWTGCGLGLRCYMPREVTKFGSSPWPNLNPPNPDIDWIRLPFTRDGLKTFVQRGIDHATRLKLRPMYAEAGVTEEVTPGLRSQPASVAYLADMHSVFKELGVGATEWIDPVLTTAVVGG